MTQILLLFDVNFSWIKSVLRNYTNDEEYFEEFDKGKI